MSLQRVTKTSHPSSTNLVHEVTHYATHTPFCGSQMKIVAFITEHATVCHILEHIHMPPQRPEPLAHSPPLQDELLYA